jgi:hypothetical protein
MTQLLVIRCSNGNVGWVYVSPSRGHFAWRCLRDSFVVNAPSDPAQIEAVLQSIISHSVSLSGPIQQIIQLAL